MTQSTQGNGGAATTDAQAAPPFDLAKDPIPSFGSLQHERARIFGRRNEFESFRRTVEKLSDSGEEGRRKGLGLWMVGDFEQAIGHLEQHADDDVAAFTLANALMSAGRPGDALPIFERLSQKYPEEPRPRGGWLDARLEAHLVEKGEEAALEALSKALEGSPPSFVESAEGRYLWGRCYELRREFQEAIERYAAAREADPTHRLNLFCMAYLAERTGLDELSLECYESLANMLPIDSNVLMNLGILYEDLGRDRDAAACYDTVVKTAPTNRRARLFLADAAAGINMYYDEDLEKKEDRLNQILRIPITDFELSVRARNCLSKMGINTLGDMVEKPETELLTYKNFGETSLAEIKEILASKGLRLGMAREEAVVSIARASARPGPMGAQVDSGDVRLKPISELGLSIRARRAVENVGCLSVGDIADHSEQELLARPNFGVTSLLELKTKLGENGVKLKGD